MNLTKNPLFYLSLILAVIVGLQIWGIVSAQTTTFQEPTDAFPTSDVSAPVETGAVSQTKYQTLSFAPVASTTDIRVSVGLDGLYLKNDIELPEDIRTLSGFVSNWDMFKNFVRVWSGPDAGIISYEGGVRIQREEEQVITPAIPAKAAYCDGTPYIYGDCYSFPDEEDCLGIDGTEIVYPSWYFYCAWVSNGNGGFCVEDVTDCDDTTAIPGWTESEACDARFGCTWHPYQPYVPMVTSTVIVPSMEVKSDGNVEIAGNLTTGASSKMWIGEEDGRISYLCGGKFNMLYGSHEMDCVSLHSWINFTTSKVGSRWSEHINKCVKNMRLYVTGCEHPTEWPCGEVGSNYEEHESGRGFKVWDVSNNTISVMIWRDSSKDNSAVGCKFVTQILIDGIDGSGGSGWITGYLKADEIWEPTTAIFGD